MEYYILNVLVVKEVRARELDDIIKILGGKEVRARAMRSHACEASVS